MGGARPPAFIIQYLPSRKKLWTVYAPAEKADTFPLFLLYPYMYSVVCTHRLTFVFLSSTFFVGRIFRLISLCTLLWEWLAFIHTSLKQLSINILAKVHVLFDISNIRPKYPEADFMNVDFHWAFWA